MYRIGYGYDQHKFIEGKKLRLGGVEIPSDFGLLAHSDGDALLHALCDALLGAIGRGDIGELFPDTDEQFRDADSALFVRQVMKMVEREGYRVSNLDALVIADQPKLTPYKKEIKNRIASLLKSEPACVNVKATRTEGMGMLAGSKGLAAQVVILLIKEAK